MKNTTYTLLDLINESARYRAGCVTGMTAEEERDIWQAYCQAFDAAAEVFGLDRLEEITESQMYKDAVEDMKQSILRFN